jgi:hypothetical protein
MNEPDWTNSKTGLMEWKNPSLPMNMRLELADNAVRARDKLIRDLRKELADADKRLSDYGWAETMRLGGAK